MFLLQKLCSRKVLQKAKTTTTKSKLTDCLGRFSFPSSIAGKRIDETVTEEHCTHLQAVSSNKRLICSTIAWFNNSSHEVLLDSGSNISSIRTQLVQQLKLQTFEATPIQILFRDKKQVYHSHTQVRYTFFLSHQHFSHSFYVLPHQLFPLTLGCDWFIKTRAQLHFDSSKLILPQSLPIPIFKETPTSIATVNTKIEQIDAPIRLKDIREIL